MRVLQIIDSLTPGGAEKMAVNFANEWVNHAQKSFLIVTNTTGELEKQIDNQVIYKIHERSTFNIIFIMLKVLWFIKKNKITHVQAHTTSYKWAKWIKTVFPQVKFYWHDHNGNRVNWEFKKNKQIINTSQYFDGVLTCNTELENWAKSNLKLSKVKYIPNFATSNITDKNTILYGENNKRIVCLANWREPKNHLFLVEAFKQANIASQGWSLHLVGKIFNDEYAKQVKESISDKKENNIFYYNLKTDTNFILSQAQIGILVSTYEGFPVTLLEYGLMGLCPIVSNVGYMPKLVKNKIEGWVVNPNSSEELIAVFKELPHDNKITLMAQKFSDKIKENFGGNAVVQQVKSFWND